MVEISGQVQNGHTVAQLNGKIASDCAGKDKVKADDEDRLPEPDLGLVAEVRQLVKAEWDKDPEGSEAIYSKYHYDEIMEAGAPFTCWRYLLHMEQDVKAAAQLIQATMKWRKENRIDELEPKDLFKDVWLRAPIGIVGKAKNGLDIAYAIGKNYRKPDPMVKQTVRDFIGYLLFEWDRKHRYDLEQFIAVFDVSETGFSNLDVDFAKWLISIRDFAPSRVKAIYVVGIPFIVRPLIKLFISWLPERYRRITHCGTFDELVSKNIDKDNLPVEVGGSAPDTWRLAPPEAIWAEQAQTDDNKKLYDKICECSSFNTTQEKLDELYKMQRDYEMTKKNMN